MGAALGRESRVVKATEHELWQDEHAATLRSRDRHREPHRLFPVLRHGPQRNNTHTVKLSCPACGSRIFVAADSDGETVTCMHPDCHAQLETFQLDGVVTLEIATLDLAPDGDV